MKVAVGLPYPRGSVDIAYVGPVPPLSGGIAQHGARLTEALQAAGHTVEVYSWAAQFPARLYKGPGPDESSAPTTATVDLRWWDPGSWWRTGTRARRAELLVLPWVTSFTAPAYRTIIAAARIPVVVVVHNLLPHERHPGDLHVARWILRRARGAVLHTEEEARLVESFGVLTAVVGHPPNLAVEPAPLPAHPPYRLLFFGHVRPYKGLDIALAAVRALRDRNVDVRLTVAGHFWDPIDAWRRRVEALGLSDVVALQPGYVSDDGLSELFAVHHLVVAPYRTATGSGIVPLARAAGRLVVATRVGGLAEAVTEGRDGTLADEPEPAAFADAIEKALPLIDRDPAGSSAPTWQEVADKVVELGR